MGRNPALEHQLWARLFSEAPALSVAPFLLEDFTVMVATAQGREEFLPNGLWSSVFLLHPVAVPTPL